MRSEKTIEVLSCPQTTGDLWDELQKDLNPLKKFLFFRENREYTIRLLGPFMQASRLYNPQSELVTEYDIDVKRIASKDSDYFDKVIKQVQTLIKAHPRSTKKYPELGKFLLNIYKNFGFQKCVITNAYIKSGDNRDEPKVKLVALSSAMCQEIVQKVPEENTKISGLNARDITVSRKGSGLITRYDVAVRKEALLDKKVVQKIFSQGLVDIPSLLNAMNKRNGAFYYQFQSDQYQMPEELVNALFNGMSKDEENQQLNRANQKLNTLPRNAFERVNRPMGSINSLELD